MKIEREVNLGNNRFELTAFQRFSAVGAIAIPVPGFCVYCVACDQEQKPLWGDFVKTPTGDPIVFETADLAFEEAEKMIGI